MRTAWHGGQEPRHRERGSDRFARMVHDEYVRVARKLVRTGLPPDIGVQLTDLEKFFPGNAALDDGEPFPVEVLAGQALHAEREG